MKASSTASFDLGALLARVSLALLFVPAGLGKIGGFAGAAGYIASKGLPLPQAGAALAIAVELGLGLALLAGFKTRWTALGLALFVAAATPLFHNYWALPEAQVMVQKLMFWKNVGIFGGLALLASVGGGRWALDSLRGQAPVARAAAA